MVRRLAALVLAGLASMPAQGMAKCQIAKDVEIPVTIEDRRPIVAVKINGHDARFVLDSSAWGSTISSATVAALGLPVHESRSEMATVSGLVPIKMARVDTLGIAGHSVLNYDIMVDESTPGLAGRIGRNILDIEDVEYDLPHGFVRLMKGDGCETSSMAYWAGSRPFTALDIEHWVNGDGGTVATIAINGVKLRAEFDSGFAVSVVALPAAKRFGVTLQSLSATAADLTKGENPGWSRLLRGQAASIDIGGEKIARPWLYFADKQLGGADMLLGIDFFLTHRIYVDNRNHRIFLTYEGGPVFGLDPHGAVDASGAAIPVGSVAENDAAGHIRRAEAFVAANRFDAAIADFDKAVALQPGNPQFLLQRAAAHRLNRHPLLAAADLDKAVALAPANPDARLARAELALARHDEAGSLADLKAADQALAPAADARLRLAELYALANAGDAAIASYDLWLKSHAENNDRAIAFEGRCLVRARMKRDLDKALDDCDATLKLWRENGRFLASRGVVRFARDEFGKALADFSAAARADPKEAWPLYARAIVERRMGKTADADKDRAAALAIDPKVGEQAKQYGLE